MKVFYKFFVAAGLISLVSACATTSTTGEPPVHVSDCHTKDGMLLNSSECVTTHNDIVAEQEKARAARRSALEHAGRRSLR